MKYYVAPSGRTILVGTNAKENDTLTHSIADAQDTWMHAADASGAHVVLRRGGGAGGVGDKDEYEKDIRYASGVAAHHSLHSRSGSGGGCATQRVLVTVAQVSDVRKGRGSGCAIVQRGRTVTAKKVLGSYLPSLL